MNKTLIIYDSVGDLFTSMSGNYQVPQGALSYLEIEIPVGKRIASVNTTATPHVPVYEDLPIDPVEQVKADLAYLAMMMEVEL